MRKQHAGLFLFFVLGCATLKPMDLPPSHEALLPQVKDFQEIWSARNYTALSKKEGEISCQTPDGACSQLHLMAGSACFWTFRYACAADHLEQGMTHAVQEDLQILGLDRLQTHLNLLEALRSQQARETGEASLQIARRLLGAATAFRVLAPNHPAGPFFLGSAQFVFLRHEMLDTKDPDRFCRELSELIRLVEEAGAPSPNIRDTTHYRQILSDMASTQQTLPRCHSEASP